jgi:prophage regulatory protein
MSEPHRLNRMYRLRDLPQFVGLRRTQIGELIKLGKFPRPVSLSDGGRAVAWLESDLLSWQNTRIAARNAEIVGDAASGA